MCPGVAVALLVAAARCAPADDVKPVVRPITEADTVLAVYWTNMSLAVAPPSDRLVLAIWPDGRAVWSADRVRGGPPYFEGRVEPKRVTALLDRFDREGLFADETLNRAHFGPDSQFNTVLVKSGKR